MSLDAKIRHTLEDALETIDAAGVKSGRLQEDAWRLWARVQALSGRGVIELAPGTANEVALELACFALQLPLGKSRAPAPRRTGRLTLKERCEEAAELLILEIGALIDEAVLDLAARILREAPHPSPMLDESRLLADALSLDDFGIIGLTRQMSDRSLQGQGVGALSAGLARREAYGYWDARLKDGFHFEAVRKIARRRLEHARQAAVWLAEELSEDQPAQGTGAGEDAPEGS
jgi:hypothetical protein